MHRIDERFKNKHNKRILQTHFNHNIKAKDTKKLLKLMHKEQQKKLSYLIPKEQENHIR